MNRTPAPSNICAATSASGATSFPSTPRYFRVRGPPRPSTAAMSAMEVPGFAPADSGETFVEGALAESYEVRVIDPASLPCADIVKIDIEGGEGDVLDHLDLSRTSLVLLEYQNRKNRDQAHARLVTDFIVDGVDISDIRCSIRAATAPASRATSMAACSPPARASRG